MTGQRVNRERQYVALLCGELPLLHLLAKDEGLLPALETIVGEAKTGKDISSELLELLRRLGIPAGWEQRGQMPDLLGMADRPSVGEIYVCPFNLCDRLWVRIPGVAIEQCTIGRCPMDLRKSQ